MPKMAVQCPECGAQNLVFSRRMRKFNLLHQYCCKEREKLKLGVGLIGLVNIWKQG
jgi:ssDNA-binding Zn-finger/Zn-ribbon topoisomerase 1